MSLPTDKINVENNPVSNNRLRAQIYFAVGVGSEGAVAGRDVSTRLSFAGTSVNGRLYPEGNSGYSLGMLQTDLGPHPEVARDLVEAFRGWSGSTHQGWQISLDEAEALSKALARNGRQIKAEGNTPIAVPWKERLDAFLATDSGRRFVHAHDVFQVGVVLDAIAPKLSTNALIAASSERDQARLATILFKLQNQSGSEPPAKLLRQMNDGTLRSVDDVIAAVGRIMPGNHGRADYLESGRDDALAATESFILLSRLDRGSPLGAAWSAVLDDPLINPATLHTNLNRPDIAAQYETVKTIFLQRTESPAFIRAVDEGATHIYGRPQPQGKLAATAGLFSSGDNLVVWNRDGAGYSFIDGAWTPVAREDLKRVTLPDKTIDLRIARDGVDATLMHLDRNAPVLRPETPTGRQEAQSPTTPGLPEPLDEQARDAVRRLDASLGRTTDDMSLRMASSLAALARQHDIARIDHVVLSHANPYLAAGEHVFVVQGRLDDPAQVRAQMRTDDALSGVELRTQLDVGDTRARMPAQMAPDPGQQVDPPCRGLV